MNEYGKLQDTDAWEPVNATVTSCPNCRSPDRYITVLQQFNITQNPRYQPRDNNTFCNIFCGDVTKAMGCEAFHWWLGKELSANALLDWLIKIGPSYGWNKTDALTAQSFARQGCPAIVGWQNPKGPGHVAMVIPSTLPELRIAQAGGRCLYNVPIVNGFGNAAPLLFFTHN